MNMMNLICWSIVEAIKYFLVVRGVLGLRIRSGWIKYCMVLYVVAGIPVFRMVTDGRILYMTFFGWVLLLFCFQENWTDQLKAFIVSKLLIDIVELFLWSIQVNSFLILQQKNFPLIFGWIEFLPAPGWADFIRDSGGSEWTRPEGIVLGCLFWLCVASAVKKKREKIRTYFVELSFGWTAVVVVVLLSLELMAGGIQSSEDIQSSGRQQGIVLLIYMFGMILVLIGSVTFIYTMLSKKRLQQLHQMEKEHSYLQQKYYEGRLQKYDEIQQFRHDMMKHMKVIRLLCENHDVDELKEYVEDFLAGYPERDVVYTGNIIADYFISETISELYEKEGFRYRVMGRFPEHILVSDTELCILMANALENAQNAIRLVRGPSELVIEIRHYKEHIVISIQNTKAEDVGVAGNTAETSRGQGYGIKNMRAVVEKHGGSIEIQEENDRYSVQIFV